jgi:hypothetical protein
MRPPAVRLGLCVVTTTAVLHVAATPPVVGSISRCASSIGAMLHEYLVFQPCYFLLNLLALNLSLDNLPLQFRNLRPQAFLTIIMVVNLRPPVSASFELTPFRWRSRTRGYIFCTVVVSRILVRVVLARDAESLLLLLTMPTPPRRCPTPALGRLPATNTSAATACSLPCRLIAARCLLD